MGSHHGEENLPETSLDNFAEDVYYAPNYDEGSLFPEGCCSFEKPPGPGQRGTTDSDIGAPVRTNLFSAPSWQTTHPETRAIVRTPSEATLENCLSSWFRKKVRLLGSTPAFLRAPSTRCSTRTLRSVHNNIIVPKGNSHLSMVGSVGCTANQALYKFLRAVAWGSKARRRATSCSTTRYPAPPINLEDRFPL